MNPERKLGLLTEGFRLLAKWQLWVGNHECQSHEELRQLESIISALDNEAKPSSSIPVNADDLERHLYEMFVSVEYMEQWGPVAVEVQRLIREAVKKATMKDGITVGCTVFRGGAGGKGDCVVVVENPKPTPPPPDDGLAMELGRVIDSPGPGWLDRLAAHVRRMANDAVKAERDRLTKEAASAKCGPPGVCSSERP